MSGIGRASAFLASGTIVSRILGFVKAIVLLEALGVIGVSGDAFGTATAIPNSIYAVIGGGLLSAVLVPQIVRASKAEDGGRAFINKVVTIAIVVFAIVAIAATAAAPLLVQVVGAKSAELSTAFAYWVMPQIFFLGLYALLGEVLNARRYFGPFTWAPVANNIVGITSLFVFIALFGSDAGGSRTTDDWSPEMVGFLGGGATLGMVVQALLLAYFWRRIGLSYRPDFRWRGVGLRATGTAAGWTLGMLVATQAAGIIEINVANDASGDEASVIALTTAWLIFMLPHSVITVSLVTAFYPRMAEHAVSDDQQSLRRDIATALRAVALPLVLASAAITVAAYPFAQVFTPQFADVQALASVIVAYGIGLVPFSLLFVVQRAFYAMGNTRTPFFFTVTQALIVIVGVLVCATLPKDQIAPGIALVVSGATLIQLLVAATLLYRRIGWAGRGVPRSLMTNLGAIAPAAAVGFATASLVGSFSPTGFAMQGRLEALVAMGAIGAAMALVYLLCLALFRSPDLRIVGDTIARLRRR